LFDFNDDGLRLHICQSARNWLRLRCERCHAERIGVGPRAGQKVFTLQSVPAQGERGKGATQQRRPAGSRCMLGSTSSPGQRGKGKRSAEEGIDQPAVPRHVAR
jgi:hypothetical protein